MKIIREQKGIWGTGFDIEIEGVIVQRITVQRISMNYKGKLFMFLVNSMGEVIQSVFEFLNVEHEDSSPKGREQMTSALKLFYCFLEIIKKEPRDFNTKDVKMLSAFLLGLSSEGMYEKWTLHTSRSISTHNLYLDVIRRYMKFKGEDNKHLFKQTSVKVEKNGFGRMEHVKSIEVQKYQTNISKHPSFKQYVPKFISVNEYHAIQTANKNLFPKQALRNQIIIDLMYTKGLRLGEVLGITLEDIKEHPEDSTAGIIILRNRLSDMSHQRAKRLPIPKSRLEYKTAIYQERQTEIVIPPDLMELIRRYIDESRSMFDVTEKVLENILLDSKADSVAGDEDNYYLFLNKNGGSLSSEGWGKILKVLFKEAGLRIDKGTKRNNLSHRFRHGYAMYLIDVLKKEIHEVKDKMRHKSLSATMVYYNPRPERILEETIEIRENFKKKLLGEEE